MIKEKTPKESLVIHSEMVMPNDANPFNNLMGGVLMRMMDVVGAISAQRHSESLVVTASVDNVSFTKSVPIGGVVTLEAKVTRAFNTSMEVYVSVLGEVIPKGIKMKTNEAFVTFVACDEYGNPRPVHQVTPETEMEQKLYEGALRRRQLRLILSGRLNPADATAFKQLF